MHEENSSNSIALDWRPAPARPASPRRRRRSAVVAGVGFLSVLAFAAAVGLGSFGSGAPDRLIPAQGLATPNDGSGEPEMGTTSPPAEVRQRLMEYRGPNGTDDANFARADVLAKYQASGSELLAVGVSRSGGTLCWSVYAGVDPGSANVTCTRAEWKQPPLSSARADGISGVLGVASGWAPPGTRSVQLTAGNEQRTVAVQSGGSRWKGHSFYLAEWPVDVDTTVTAFDANGRVIATVASHGISRSQ